MDTKSKNTIYLSHWLLTCWSLLFCLTAFAQDTPDDDTTSGYAIDVNIFNRYDDHFIDSTYMGNSEVFRMLDSLMQDTVIINHTRRIKVLTSSSIEGTVAYNTALSIRRMNVIEKTFRERYDYIEEDVWEFNYTPENWAHLRKAVVLDSNVPYQEEVLSIIDRVERPPDAREYLLKILADSVPWDYIHEHILPASRGSVSMLFVPATPALIPTIQPFIATQRVVTPQLHLPTPTQSATYSRPILSIRSNLLLDLSSTLNIGIEVPLAPRWSLSAEYIHPWWKHWDSALTWQIQSLYFDVRYWLGYRGEYNYLNGWSVGLYAGSGWYDLQPFQDTGVQGEYTDYGATLSYAHFLGKSKHWLLEYTLGLGYVTTHYRNYYTVADTEEYGNIKVHNYPWGEETLRAPVPTRLGVTLAYLITVNGLKKRGGVR